MAGVASRGQAYELSDRGIDVAIVALQQSMRPYQGKPVFVIAYLLQRDLPTLDRMAVFAVSAELTAMNVRVAVGASRTDILEDQTDMAFDAGHLFVHSAQWITGVVVIKLWIRPDRFPTGECVAIPAGCGDGTVWIGDLGLGSTDGSARAVRGLL